MITSFTAFLFNILANLSRRILKAELSNLTQRVQMAECDEIDLNRRIKALTDENKDFARVARELGKDNKELQDKLTQVQQFVCGEHNLKLRISRQTDEIERLTTEHTSLTSEIGRLTQALADSGNENRTLTSQLNETKTKLDAALMEAYGLQSQHRQDISTISRMEQDITKLTQAFSDLGTDRDRLSRCIKDITDALKFYQKQTQASSQAPQPITDWRLNTFRADSGTTETPMNNTQKVT